MDKFLPETYDDNENLNETGGNYMKFEQGENKIRILSSPIVGWEWWETTKDGGRKPVRVRIDEKIDVSTLEDPESVKRFWAMSVYNYKTKRVEILEITQKGIQRTLKALARDKDWGSPLGYNLSIVREGEDLKTKYEVIPSPPKQLDKEIKDAYEAMSINLEALFDGDDPFEAKVTDEDLEEVE